MNIRTTVIFFLLSTLILVQQANGQDGFVELVSTPEHLPNPIGGYDSLHNWIDEQMIWEQGQLTIVGTSLVVG